MLQIPSKILPKGLTPFGKIKTISGRRWNPQRKYWEVPYRDYTLLM